MNLHKKYKIIQLSTASLNLELYIRLYWYKLFYVFNFLINIQQMRLRHTKPINSYAGQANHDANDAKDEDFMRNYNSSKKLRNGKQKATTEQNKKLAQILCEFVALTNSDYRNYLNKNQQPLQQAHQKEVKGSKKIICKTEKDYQIDNGKFEEIVLKQQQKNQRAQKNINKSLLTKKIKKEKSSRVELARSKESKQQVNVSLSESQPLNIIQTQKNNIEQNCEKQKPKETTLPELQNPNPKSNFSPTQQLQPIQQFQQQMMQNPLFAMNPALYSLYYPFPQVTYQAYLEQLKANPYMAMHYMNMMSPNYISFSKLPFNNTNPAQQKKEQNQKAKIQLNTNKQQAEKSKTQRKLSQQKTQISLKTNQPIDFKNKSCHHVAIAYNIHFSKLKEKGLLQNINNSKEYEKLDPTFLAKKVREKKVTQHLTSIQQNSTYN